ncbi:ABC transporter ATP-binding protein [Bacillus sp. B-jedd]|uniref:ABC transporter ATP-binding protein n=1 Tax=Bacillus sp. B-jedd TaxID=1476857 RepID=UPI00051562B2|nr:ATP-binding cassette domain-containing protein [Bacillus sp. B-jedd]CEG28862.1 ABC transporter-like protein [Bacillus sp. B-jedd]
MKPYLHFRDIKQYFGKRKVLDIPEFSISGGEFLGVMGPNGAGKSTFLKIASFLETPSEGTISYQGVEVPTGGAPLELRRKFSIALQQPLLLDTTVMQNIAVGLKLRKVPRAEIWQRVEMWMDRFQISHLARKNARFLSGGEAQRVSLARAMIIEPEILFLDEPFSALDFPTKIKLMEDFKGIFADAGTTAMFVSHDLAEVKFLTSRLAIMVGGEIKQAGPTREVLADPNDEAAGFLEVWKRYSV